MLPPEPGPAVLLIPGHLALSVVARTRRTSITLPNGHARVGCCDVGSLVGEWSTPTHCRTTDHPSRNLRDIRSGTRAILSKLRQERHTGRGGCQCRRVWSHVVD